jgi:hypothetical protein
MDDDQTQDITPPTQPMPQPAPSLVDSLETVPILTTVPVETESGHSDGSKPANLPPEAPESPINASAKVLTEDQNQGVNQPESEVPEPSNEAPISAHVQSVPTESTLSAPAPLTPQAPQPQSPAQQDQTGFIRALLAKAQAKIQSNKQKKLDIIVLFAQKKKIVANEDIQLLLHISSATATRYIVKLVQQGRLVRVGNPRDAKYQFLR